MEFQGASFQGLGGWLLRLAKLDLSVFDDVKDEVAATLPAITVVLAASFLAGLGSWLWWIQQDFGPGVDEKTFEVFFKSLILGGIFQSALWFLWVYVSAMVLSRGFGASADINQMVRTMGLAFAPMAISVLMVIRVLTVPFGVIGIAGALLLSNVAIQATTTADSRQVVLANVVGFLVFAIVLGILANISEVYNWGGLAPGLFFFNLNP
jgi:hypothetical protein